MPDCDDDNLALHRAVIDPVRKSADGTHTYIASHSLSGQRVGAEEVQGTANLVGKGAAQSWLSSIIEESDGPKFRLRLAKEAKRRHFNSRSISASASSASTASVRPLS